MIFRLKLLTVLSACALLVTGCAVAPSSIVSSPTTARPVIVAPVTVANGSIYQVATYKPLFEDRRARAVGDLITVSINEKTSAGKQGSSSASNSNSAKTAIPSLFGKPFPSGSLSVSSSGKRDEKDATSSTNNFTGTLTATVTDVLPNGNMVISGEKQVSMDTGIEYIRFSGVVSPVSIGAGNTVSSTQIADVRAEYRTNTQLDAASVLGFLARFFLNVLPI